MNGGVTTRGTIRAFESRGRGTRAESRSLGRAMRARPQERGAPRLRPVFEGRGRGTRAESRILGRVRGARPLRSVARPGCVRFWRAEDEGREPSAEFWGGRWGRGHSGAWRAQVAAGFREPRTRDESRAPNFGEGEGGRGHRSVALPGFVRFSRAEDEGREPRAEFWGGRWGRGHRSVARPGCVRFWRAEDEGREPSAEFWGGRWGRGHSGAWCAQVAAGFRARS